MKITAAVTLSLPTLPFRLCVLFRQLAQDRNAQNAVHGNHRETVPSTGAPMIWAVMTIIVLVLAWAVLVHL